MDEIELSDADYERNGDYYYIGNDFYYKVDIWTGLERVNIIYKVKGKKEQDIEYSDPIEIIKIGQPWKYNYYKKFVKFLKERE